jgi:hypothetical protein
LLDGKRENEQRHMRAHACSSTHNRHHTFSDVRRQTVTLHSLLYPLLMHARTHARVSCSHSDPKQLYLELQELKEKEARCETQFARLPWIDKQSRSVAASPCWCSSPHMRRKSFFIPAMQLVHVHWGAVLGRITLSS